MLQIYVLCLLGASAEQDINTAGIAQLGERTTEDRKVPGSKPGFGNSFAPTHIFSFGQ